MRKNRANAVTLGCSRNLVDLEQLIRQFVASDYMVKHGPHRINGEIVVVNTCGFIGDAREESINMILELGERKQKGRVERLFVMGCLSECFLKDLKKELPEVDHFYGKFNWKGLISDLGKPYCRELATGHILTTPRYYAYVKIREGYNRTCSYYSISIITGAYQSHPMNEIADEVRGLVAQGVKEFQMTTQDLMLYSLDRYKRMALPELVGWISDIPGMKWIRLHHGYPFHFPYDLLPVMRERNNIRRYMDIALQRISDPMLGIIHHSTTEVETYKLLGRMRREMPDTHLRTTLMVGHPGGTEQGSKELIRFVKDIHIEHMGTFAYNYGKSIYAYQHYKDGIPQGVEQDRLDYLIRIQEGVSAGMNASKVGQTFRVIAGRGREGLYVGRTQYNSPEVDPEILISKDTPLGPGNFYRVKVIDAQTFDLYGKVLD